MRYGVLTLLLTACSTTTTVITQAAASSPSPSPSSTYVSTPAWGDDVPDPTPTQVADPRCMPKARVASLVRYAGSQMQQGGSSFSLGLLGASATHSRKAAAAFNKAGGLSKDYPSLAREMHATATDLYKTATALNVGNLNNVLAYLKSSVAHEKAANTALNNMHVNNC